MLLSSFLIFDENFVPGELTMSDRLHENLCVICRKPFTEQDDVNVVTRGKETLIDFSTKYGDSELLTYLQSNPAVVKVHNNCRKNYTSSRRLEQFLKRPTSDTEPEVVQIKALRSCYKSFTWKLHCFFCGELCTEDDRHPERMDNRVVRTLQIRDSVLDMCAKRLLLCETDAVAQAVQRRLLTCCDLVAEEAVYHRRCHTNFFDYCSVRKVGRPIDKGKEEGFERLCNWLEETNNELLTVGELSDMAASLTGTSESYSEKWLKTKLQERYRDHIIFAEVAGRKNVICWKKMAAYIINDKWYEDRCRSVDEESERVIIAAAKLIKFAVKEMECDMSKYPTCQSFASKEDATNWIPPLLQKFMSTLVSADIKAVALGQALVQAVRPKSVIAPLLFGLGVSLDHLVGSKLVINLLHRLGYCVSYDELTRFKQCVVQGQDDMEMTCSDAFTQFAADNVDHNTCTMNGLQTFHGMGIISMSTPYSLSDHHFGDIPIRRLQKTTVAEIVRNRGIPLVHYSQPQRSALSALSFKSRQFIQDLFDKPVSTAEDIMWHVGWFFRDADRLRYGWSGFMHDLHQHSSLSRVQSAVITMHPIIDQQPGEISTIYSTLLYVDQQGKRLGLPTPCVTFDHPLWIKAVDIVHSEKLNVLCRLGPFHMLMSFLGSIGKLMTGSGLVEALQVCYGTNTISHMLSGKAFKRAVRGHFMMDAALKVMLFQRLMSPAGQSDSECMLQPDDIQSLHTVYSDVVDHRMDVHNLSQCEVLVKLRQVLMDQERSLAERSRTAKLWLQYCRYIDLLKAFIRAERLGDWNLHLTCVAQMLNLYAAAGHWNYAKSARLYLQLMLDLPETSPWLHGKFANEGLHSVRRSDRVWAGLSTDLTIEQTMMQSVKGRSGLTHGRGMSENVRLTWLKTMHKCATVYATLCSLTNLDQSSDSFQHADCSTSQAKRDCDDISKLLAWLEANDPFDTQDCRLRSLGSGVSAVTGDGVNCDSAEEVGAGIMTKLDDCVYSEVVMKKADTVKTLADIATVCAPRQKQLNLDNGLLFSRLLVICSRERDIESYFQYEMTSTPAALFKDGFMRKVDKAQLQHELLNTVDTSFMIIPRCVYVIDGGCLLHRVKWEKGATYAAIAQQYNQYVSKHYGVSTVVFDGYEASVKDHEHERRATKCAPNVVVDPGRNAYFDQGTFLANQENKKSFIDLLTKCLRDAGHSVHQASDDADTLLVHTALQCARQQRPVVVVANDTDVLVLLIYHIHVCAEPDSISDVYMLSEVTSRKIQPKMLIPVQSSRGVGSLRCSGVACHSCFNWVRLHIGIIWTGKKASVETAHRQG